MARAQPRTIGIEARREQEEQINIASRLSALEYFTCHVLTAALPREARDPLTVDDMHRRMLEEFGVMDARVVTDDNSEFAMSELYYAIRRLISLQRELLRMPRRPRP